MKNFTNCLLVLCIICISNKTFATSITVYKVKKECKYILVDNKNVPVATWKSPFNKLVSKLESIDIKAGGELWKMLKKMAPKISLNNIAVNFISNHTSINHWESIDIPKIAFHQFVVGKDFNITPNSISTAQDYNSSRSNKANGIATVVDTSITNNPEPAEAQDYNSSRSNKPRPITTVMDSSTTENPGRAEAQDYNSSRSNKANGIAAVVDTSVTNNPEPAEAQDYNSSRSNKANGIVAVVDTSITNNPEPAEAQDYNSSRSNKANGIATVVDTSVTNNPEPAEAQDYNSSRSNKANGIVVSGGTASGGTEGPVRAGFTFSIGYQIPLTPVLNIEVEANYFLNKFEYTPSNLLPEKIALSLKNNEENKKWNSFAFTAGPSINIGHKALYATFYAKAGILFTKPPTRLIGFAKTGSGITEEMGLVKYSGKQTSVLINTGVRINYQIKPSLSLFLSPYFATTLKNNIPYYEKEVSLAVDADGNFNQDIFSTLPYVQKQTGFKNYGIRLGIRISHK